VTRAGTGIGRATAIRLAQDGHVLALAGRRSAPLEEVAQEIRAGGGTATPVSADVSTPGGAELGAGRVASSTRATRVRIGTVVTGTSQLALYTHANFLTYASVALYALLITAWLTVATDTTRGVLHGRLFLPAGSRSAVA
jgi:NAD(P)-dependent dehydrogenase (short-subunit alcohol dehydrogenase family)